MCKLISCKQLKSLNYQVLPVALYKSNILFSIHILEGVLPHWDVAGFSSAPQSHACLLTLVTIATDSN